MSPWADALKIAEPVEKLQTLAMKKTQRFAESMQAFTGRLALVMMVGMALTQCATKKKDPNAMPKSFGKPAHDPVEQRIFYSGWMHPN